MARKNNKVPLAKFLKELKLQAKKEQKEKTETSIKYRIIKILSGAINRRYGQGKPVDQLRNGNSIVNKSGCITEKEFKKLYGLLKHELTRERGDNRFFRAAYREESKKVNRTVDNLLLKLQETQYIEWKEIKKRKAHSKKTQQENKNPNKVYLTQESLTSETDFSNIKSRFPHRGYVKFQC